MLGKHLLVTRRRERRQRNVVSVTNDCFPIFLCNLEEGNGEEKKRGGAIWSRSSSFALSGFLRRFRPVAGQAGRRCRQSRRRRRSRDGCAGRVGLFGGTGLLRGRHVISTRWRLTFRPFPSLTDWRATRAVLLHVGSHRGPPLVGAVLYENKKKHNFD